MVLLGVIVRVVEGPGTHPLYVVPHVPVEDGHKLEERLRTGREFQAASCVWVGGALKAKPPRYTKVDLRNQGEGRTME